jgi:UDP-N-acetylglucosamine--N-acetylmuramyl-(pentapeptide) pyrophosphoryl-undecaprenol N-acetylglucosamine transferase
VKLAFGSVEAFVALVRFRPHAVFGTGGYVSFPVVVAAVLLRVPTVIHEQNRYPGLANRILSRLVRRVVTTYEDETGSFPRKKCRLTGMPLRQDIVRLAGARVSPAQFGLDPAKCTLFLLGGSQGAHSLNIAMIDAISLLDPARYQVIFMTGKDDREMVKERLRGSRVKSYIAPFFEDIAKAYAACDIVICRAGASTLAEITLFGLPAILVPYPYAARGHQEANSRVMVEAGAATMILNKELDGQKLARLIEELASDLNKLAAMSEKSRGLARPHAASEIVDMILDAASRKH